MGRSGVAGDPVEPCPDEGDLEVVCDIEEEDGDIEMECESEEEDDPDLEFDCAVNGAEAVSKAREPRDKDGAAEEESEEREEEEDEDDPDLDFDCVLDEEEEADLELVCEGTDEDEPDLDFDSAVEEATREPAKDSINSNA